jgi:hypothetical protein
MWPAGSEAPLGESSEKYRVTVQGSSATVTFEALEPQIAIAADALTGITGAVAVSVVQIGDFAQSRPVTASVTLG